MAGASPGLATTAATATITLLLYGARAPGGRSHAFDTAGGEIRVHPVSHASSVTETPARTIYSDPVGGASAYADYPEPDLILVTHRHVSTVRNVLRWSASRKCPRRRLEFSA